MINASSGKMFKYKKEEEEYREIKNKKQMFLNSGFEMFIHKPMGDITELPFCTTFVL